MKPLLYLNVIAIFFVMSLAGCARSKTYNNDQMYYRADTNSASKNITNSKLEKYGQPKKKIFVLAFMNDTPFSDDSLGEAASQELLRILKISGKAVVPDDLRATSVSRDYYSGNKIRLSPLIREGKKLGVSLMVVGRITKVQYRQKGDEVGIFRQKQAIAVADIEMRVFDCAEGKEVLFDQKSADSTSSQVNLFNDDGSGDPKNQRLELVREAIKNGARLTSATIIRAIDKISWEGRIAKITGGKVYVNAGRASGLNLGDILKVLTPGEDIYDPLTGAYMGRSTGQPKGTLEIVDFLGPDASVTTIHSGGGFFEGDTVQLY